ADGQNIGFAVPVNQAKRILKDLRAGRPVSRGALGISLAELDAAFQASLGVKEGVVVSEVFSGQAADKAKVERLDVITAIDGEPVRSQDDLVGIVSSRRAGDRVVLSVVREGKRKEIPVVLGDRKDLQEGEDDGQDGEREGSKEDGGRELDLEKTYGFKVAPLTPATRHQYRLAEDRKGVVVVSVSTRSDAAEKLAVGNVISAVGTRDVETLAQFNAEVKKLGGKSLILKVQASQGPAAITVAIPPR
ncbi:MAG TPA: PDZ domain-containing protein, partial [Holophaga sp.]|nr:PDZ domain-containing protein [Holophaga sp.]